MATVEQRDRINANRVVTGSNQLINLFWSGLCLGPLGYYCYDNMVSGWLYVFLSLGLLPFLMPNALFDRTQLHSSAGYYTKLGIRTVRKYTQDGDLVNHWLRLKFPGYHPAKQVSFQQHIRKSYLNEKFHVGCFLFFLLSILYASYQGHWAWVAFMLVGNLVYNVYPILLQQYNRNRLNQLISRQALRQRG